MKQITAGEFKKVVDAGAGASDPAVDIIDVRTPEEYNNERIPGVRNVPLAELGTHMNEFSDKKTVYVHCQGGVRSSQAVDMLDAIGTGTEFVNVEGGLNACMAAGVGTTKGN